MSMMFQLTEQTSSRYDLGGSEIQLPQTTLHQPAHSPNLRDTSGVQDRASLSGIGSLEGKAWILKAPRALRKHSICFL